MTTERDEVDEGPDLPAESADPLAGAILPMIEAVFEMTAPDSPERERGMRELMSSIARIRAALCPRPRLN
jgi:hypothetical protein